MVMKMRPCICPTCATPEEREQLLADEAYNKVINEIAFSAYCADLDAGEPVRLIAYYRQLAEQKYQEVMDEL